MAGNLLTVAVDSITDGTFADEVQSSMDVRFPLYPLTVSADLVGKEQTLVRINGVIGAASGELIGAGKVVPQIIQISIGQTVRVNEDRLVIGASFSSRNLSK